MVAEQTARDRLREADVAPEQLFWFNQVVGPEALDELPADAVLPPGEDALTTETLVDLTSGEHVQGAQPVPAGTAYGKLSALRPYLRDEAQSAYSGQAGLSGKSSITRGATGWGGTKGSTGQSAGQTDVP